MCAYDNVTGVTGSVYVYKRHGLFSWSMQHEINGDVGQHYFGSSVALYGTAGLIGSIDDEGRGEKLFIIPLFIH